MIALYPSLISSNLLELGATIKNLEPWCAGFHLDVMDFHFVPNLTWGPPFINAIRTAATKQLLVHLMVTDPEKMFDLFKLQSHDIVSVHVETIHSSHIFYKIKHAQLQPSIAIGPNTPLSELDPYLAHIEHVLIMSVEPGFSGQEFLPQTFERLEQLIKLRDEKKLIFSIGLDGGINQQNLAMLKQYPIDNLAIASAIFNSKDPKEALENLL